MADVKDTWQADVGGSEEATFVLLENGKCIVICYGILGIYENEEAYWNQYSPQFIPMLIDIDDLSPL